MYIFKAVVTIMLYDCQIQFYLQSLLSILRTGAAHCFPWSCHVELPVKDDANCVGALQVCGHLGPHPFSALNMELAKTVSVLQSCLIQH